MIMQTGSSRGHVPNMPVIPIVAAIPPKLLAIATIGWETWRKFDFQSIFPIVLDTGCSR